MPKPDLSAPLRSELAFVDGKTKQPKEPLAHARVLATSRTFGWDGLYAEVGENDGWQVDNLTPVGHYIAINRTAGNFDFSVRRGDAWEPVSMPPSSLWIQPAGVPFSFDVRTTAEWCGVILEPAKLKALIGVESAIEPAVGLVDPVLAALMQAIAAEVLRGGTSGHRFADAMLLGLATQLLRLFGQAHAVPKGGVTGRVVRLVSDFVDANVARDLSVEKLAQLAGLSEAHFARAFKQTTGLSPHRFILERRLERAKRLLADTDDPLADIALACGFADQAHFSRQFSAAFGVAPSALRRQFR